MPKKEKINHIVSDIYNILKLELYWQDNNWIMVETYLKSLGFNYIPALMDYEEVPDFEPYQMVVEVKKLQDIQFCISENNDIEILYLYIEHISKFSENKKSVL